MPPPVCDDCFVSIPERVWGGLEPDRQEVIDISTLFQSLRGFGVGWSYTRSEALDY